MKEKLIDSIFYIYINIQIREEHLLYKVLHFYKIIQELFSIIHYGLILIYLQSLKIIVSPLDDKINIYEIIFIIYWLKILIYDKFS